MDLGEEKGMVGALQSSSSLEMVMKVVPPLPLCVGNCGGVLVVCMEICLFMATEVWNGNYVGGKRGETVRLIKQAKTTSSCDT